MRNKILFKRIYVNSIIDLLKEIIIMRVNRSAINDGGEIIIFLVSFFIKNYIG